MIELKTGAEELADKTRELSGFKNFSLPGVKEQVAAMLKLIGRDGIFSTYTAHDITHVESMLSMLDWLVPPQTRKAMTSADWLMTVLAIYFHDLGMVVTTDEFENRNNTPAYREFRHTLNEDNTPDTKEYIARAENMSDDARERFFFQEFIRENHARRIREWVAGRENANWGQHISPIADAVAKLMDDLPPRFREHLGIVCESHHLEDLEDRHRYPLFERYGNHHNATANVQYAALLLRTADLIHVTRDRTPSITYKSLRLSDPRSVDEWSKQHETFAVGMKTRKFDPKHSESHAIVVSADFKDEGPFFSLTEYIAYADSQIKSSKRWADKSQLTTDAADFSFPWHTFEGNILVEGNAPVRMKFELDRGRLLDLLVGHTIYNDPTVAVRELLQNAIDAVRYQYYLDTKVEAEYAQMGRVQVRWDPEHRQLVVEDDGVGMDLDTIKFHLMRVGSSFYDTDQFRAENHGFSAISRFGIGVLTCFMVSDDIEVITRKASRAYRVRMRSVHADYLLKELEEGDAVLAGFPSHGTRVRLKIRTSVNLEKRSIEEILRYWVILPECPVTFQEKGKEQARIGFNSVTDAVRRLHNVQQDDDEGNRRYIKYKALSKEMNIDPTDSVAGQQYEVGFVVSQGYTPVWNFPTRLRVNQDAAAVCVEGIRVANVMPGFVAPDQSQRLTGDASVIGLLSVRGNRSLRTTVSRATLEHDDEYLRVGGICAKLLFDHVKDEIARLAGKPGSPMSQASSAGRWLFRRLLDGVEAGTIGTALREAYETVPEIVVEKTHEREGKLYTERSFVSRKVLDEVSSFWTIESRMVDSLGTISRDLGRELALNDFLRALAPELCDTRISPVVVDAHHILKPLTATHRPRRVEFSRSHQQTVVLWERTQSSRLGWSLHSRTRSRDLNPEKWNSETAQLLSTFDVGFIPRSDVVAEYSQDTPSAEIAEVVGDVDDIYVIKTRVVTIVDASCPLGKIWNECKEIVANISEEDITTTEFRVMYVFESLMQRMCRHSGEFRVAKEVDAHPLLTLWQAVLNGIDSLFDPMQVGNIRIYGTPELLAKQVKTFDVSVYWRDWAHGD